MVLPAKGFALTFAHCSAMPLGVIVGRTTAVDSKGNVYTGETINGRRVQKFTNTQCNDGEGNGNGNGNCD